MLLFTLGSDTEVGEGNDTDCESDGIIPQIVFFNKGPIHLQALSTLSLSCEVAGIPEPEVKWFREGRILRDGDGGYQLRKITAGKWNLFVSQVAMDHSGEYAISVYNTQGSAYGTCKVSVEHKIKLPAMPDLLSSCDEFSSNHEKLFIDDTDAYTDTCDSDTKNSFRRIEMQWPNSRLVQMRNKTSPYLGAVDCTQKPEIIKRLRNTTIPEGTKLLLDVEAVLNGGSIVFYKHGNEIRETERTKITNSGLKWKLTIEPVLQQDHGPFMARISNSHGMVETRCIVNIIRLSATDIKQSMAEEAIPVFEEIMEDCQIPIGGNAKFSVNINASPKPSVRWTLNDRTFLNTDKHVKLESTSDGLHTLSLTNWATQGTVTCHVENAIGKVQCKADLCLEKSNLEKNYAIVKEEYRVHSGVTARGSYSIIRRASERKTGQEVAIKSVCRKNIDKTGIRREIIVLQQVKHDHIIRVLKSYHTVQTIISVTEWLAGGYLFQKLIDLNKYSEATVMYYVLQLLDAIQYLHERSIAHLDIRSEACLLDASRQHVKLSSFGNAREIQDDILEPLERATPEFASPEVANCLPVSCASDIYSFGIVLYMVTTGLSPFLGYSDKDTLEKVKRNEWQPWESSTKIQKPIRDIISQCFQIDPELRPSVEKIIAYIQKVRSSTEANIDAKRVKYLFLRQRYQRKRVSSNATSEPRRIYDIVNEVDENASWMIKRVSTTLLSDSSDTEDDNEEEEMIAELTFLKNEVDHMGKSWPDNSIPEIKLTGPTPLGSIVSLNTVASESTISDKRKISRLFWSLMAPLVPNLNKNSMI